MSRSISFCAFLFLVGSFCLSSQDLVAGEIQMLPPLQSDNPSSVCKDGEGNKILTWDGVTALRCARGVTIDNTGKVGVGTVTPTSRLSVEGGIQANNDTDPCIAKKAGTIRWNSSAFEGCDGSAWKEFHTGPSFGGIYQTYLCNEKNVFIPLPNIGGCRIPNPITSACSCPTGYKAYRTNDFNDPLATNSCPQQYYENRGMVSWVCVKY
ncbi:MAG: hypothetical protein EOM37_02915 [Proteobacteria bacterium]|nr:hypothetical protein [Pseudomonadota bacterium]